MSVELKVSESPVEYQDAIEFMEDRVARIHSGDAENLIWALEHPSLYTSGTSAREEDLISSKFPVFETGRGGQYTYHGPNQRIYYIMLNLKNIFQVPDIKKYIFNLEECIIKSLAEFGILGERRDGRVGIWVKMADSSEKKIAAIGVRVRHWVAYHGVSVNLSPDLSHFSGIVPCGIAEYGVTSAKELGVSISVEEFDAVFLKNFKKVFFSN